jgi:NAD(P)-dependent dehydrogenase (short-subunit alcohol dehydrogenase family)
MGLLEGKVVAVTGAGRGIGRGEALEVARQGAAVVVAEFDPAVGAEVVDEIEAAGGRAVLVPGDVADADIAQRLVFTAVAEYGRLDAVVNNAGILRDRTIVKMTPDEWDAVIRVHLRGHYAPTHAACKYWKELGRPGHLVHTTSTSGLLGNFGQSNYGAAKAGIAAFSTIVALEMARFHVTSNAIAPAARTRMTEGAYGEIPGGGGGADGEGFDFWRPENVAPMVAYLCSDASSHISGKVFGVQGDVVEVYQPWTSAAEISNGGRRWDPEVLAARVDGLLAAGGVEPQITHPMRRLRHTMTPR